MAIPKNVIYVWLGGKEKPQKVLDCINTWKAQMIDWNFIEINESNFDVNYNEYTKEAYKHKMWAFVSDVARLVALYEYGGVYMDTDVICYKPLDKFLKHKFFTGVEQKHYPITATMGAEKGSPLIKEMLDLYETKKFIKHENWWEYETNVMIMSEVLEKYIDRDKMEYQEKDGIAIYPQEVFTNRLGTTNEESYTEHLMMGVWTK